MSAAAAADATLSRQRCAFHPVREAVARCPACSRFFCRECVTEHEGRFLCAGCLRVLMMATAHAADSALASVAAKWRARLLVAGRRALALAISVAWLWWAFLLFARALASLPASFHEGTLWTR